VIRVRRATAADVEAMSRVLTASITGLCAADHRNDPDRIAGWTRNKTPAGVAAMLASPQTQLFVAERDDRVAGGGAILADAVVGLNYVSPDHRFAGVSKALLGAMESAMREAGVAEGRLQATETAHRFYRDAGWQDTGEPRADGPLGGWPMRKRL
jgi:GNAT superfamily N-acetyltransferase